MGARNAIHVATPIARTMTIMQSKEPKRTSAERRKWQKATITEPQSVVSGEWQKGMGTDSDKPTLLINGFSYTDCIPTLTVDGSESLDGNLFLKNLEGIKITFTVKRLRRKRLVKLLMSGGNSRDKANAIARTWGGNYGKNYLRYIATGRTI